MVKVGDKVEVVDSGGICPAVHLYSRFREAVEQVRAIKTYFETHKSPSLQVEEGAVGIVAAFCDRNPSCYSPKNRILCIETPTNDYFGVEESSVKVIAAGQTTLEPEDIYEGYTKTGDGFWTKQSNWDKWLL